MIIYKTTNIINKKIYVGRDSKSNSNYLGSGKILKRAIKKYGEENFVKEILEECNSIEKLYEREIYWIKKLKATNYNIGYNIESGGSFGGDTLSNHPNKKEIAEKIRRTIIDNEICKGENNPMYGKKRTEEWKQQYREKRKKWNYKLKSNEYRKRMSILMSGKNNGMYGKKQTEDAKQKMRENTNQIGENNSKAKTYRILSPDKQEYIIVGVLKKFCDEHNLSIPLLKGCKNSIVNRIGYNKKNNKKVLTTQGWSLYEIID